MKQSPKVKKIVYSDASTKGYSGYIIQKQGETIARGDFVPLKFQPAQHSENF